MDLDSDVWGDIPYSRGGKDVLHPKLDKQIDVHNALLALLDQGDHEHERRGRRAQRRRPRLRRRPDEVDARPHTRSRRASTCTSRRLDAANYAKALTETNSGISSAANDFTTYHSSYDG